MAADFYRGQRLSYSRVPCTVRYIGEVHGTKGQWLGVEWDDPARGKHDGSHDGVKYFDCQNPNPTAGSFIRPTRQSDESYGLLDALRKKYASSALGGLSGKEAIRISGKTVEEVGFEKINQQLASLHDLRVVILDGLCIRGILSRGDQKYLQERDQVSPERTVQQISGLNDEIWKQALRELEEQDLRIQELDLSRNLVEDFRDVKAIVSALKSLKALNLSGNRFRVETLEHADAWLSIHKLVRELDLDEVFLTQKEIASLIKFSGLTSLSLASNNLSSPFACMTIGSLKSLNLASNQYTSLARLPDLSTTFPSLESLSLRSNPITSLTSNEVLLSVTTLDLSSTLLPDFDSLLPIPAQFPRLTTLLTAHTPLYGLPASNLHTIARIKTLTSLNHSRISPQERTNAELYYLSSIGSELSSVPEDKEAAILERHPRYAELCDTHGAPAIKRETPVSDEPKPGSLAARLTKFTFYLPPSTSSAALPPTDPPIKEIQRELPRTVGIYKLKGLVGKMFGLRPMGLRLVWETDEWDPVPSMDDDDDDWGVSDDEEDEILPDTTDTTTEHTPQGHRTIKDPSKWARREMELMDGTKNVGFWIEDREARVRIELR